MKAIEVYNVKPNYYFATEEGKIISSYQNQDLAQSLDKNGYSRPSLVSADGRRIRVHRHRLILATFNPVEGWENLEVNHKDGNKLNNRLDNLEWCTAKENIHHAMEMGLKTRGETHGPATMTEKTALEILSRYKEGQKVTHIAREFGIGRQAVSHLVHGRSWRHLPR